MNTKMKMRMLSLLLCFVMLVGLMPITALAADTYTVTFYSGGGSGTMESVTVEAGEYTLPECTFSYEGHEFKAWAYNSNVGEQLQPGTKITIRGNIRLYAVWQAKSYTITAVSEDENKGTVTGGGTYEYGTTVALAATPKEGYVFEGWYKDGVRETGSSSFKSVLVSGEAAYTAKFTKADDIITAANAVIDAPAAGANPDMTPEVPEADKDKYTVTFYKWYDSSYNEMSAEDTFEGGKEYELRVVFEVKEGYKFEGTTFTVNGEATEVFTDENPYSVTRRKIQFQIPAAASYPVTIIGGTFAVDGTSSSGNYAPDSVIGITANAPESGKQFKEWVSDDVSFTDASAATTSFRMPAKAVTITATYEDIPVTTYTVSFAANGGTGTMEDVTAISGEYTLPANGFTAPDGKQFKAWSVDGTEKAVGDKITVTANTTVTAVWEDIPHTCDIKPVAEIEPTCTEGGKEAYYKCEGCGKFYEDALGAKEITDLAAWGNLDKLGHTESDWKSDKDNHWKECTVAACGVIIENSKAAHADANNDGKCDTCEYNVGTTTTNPDDTNKPSDDVQSPQTGDNSMILLWIALLFVSGFGLVATTVFGKKRSVR